MTTQILRHEPQQLLQAWPMHNTSWVSNSAWSRGGRLVTDVTEANSWEVRAFAEDASSNGQWPPRSYSCSFCQREFRTAQALGGHMNVHRRERAHQNQLAQLRNVRVHTSKAASQQATTTTVELLSPNSKHESIPLSMLSNSTATTSATIASLSSSPPSQESINSASLTTKSLLNPDILSPRRDGSTSLSWSPSRALFYHPYEKPSATARCKSANSGAHHGRFSLCLNKVMGEVHEDALVDLELRLGQSSCAV